MRNIIITGFIFVLFSCSLFGQGSDIHTLVNRYFVGVSVSPSLTAVTGSTEKGIDEDMKLNIQKNLELGIYLSKHFGFGIGVGQSTYSSNFILEESYEKTFFSQDDGDGDLMDLSVSVSNYEEKVTMSCINIPVQMLFRFGKKGGVYIHPGVELSLRNSLTYEHSGYYSYNGYYPAYNVTFTDLQEYGFVTNKTITGEGKNEEMVMGVNANVQAGIFFTVFRKVSISIGGHFVQGLLSLEDTPDPDEFELTRNLSDHNSIYDSYSDRTIYGFGGYFSVKYYIK